MNIKEQGAQAYRDGLKRDQNPYRGTMSHCLWVDGFITEERATCDLDDVYDEFIELLVNYIVDECDFPNETEIIRAITNVPRGTN